MEKSNNMELYFEEDDFDGHIIEVGENMKIVVKRFLDSGMSLEETSRRMDVSVTDLKTILDS